MFENFMHGLLGSAPTGEDGNPQYAPHLMQQAQAYGVDPAYLQEMQRQQRSTTLLKVGAQLLGAAQPGPVGQRGRMIAGIGDMVGDENTNVTKSLMNSAQLKIYADTLKDKKTARDNRAAVMALVGKMDLTPEQRAFAMTDPEEFLKIGERQRAAISLDKAKKEQEYASQRDMLIKGGVSDEMASGIAAGRYVVRDGQVIDIVTGGPVGQANAAPVGPRTSPVPDGLDTSKGAGGDAMLAGGLNKVAGYVGWTPAPNVQKARGVLDEINSRLVIDRSSANPGKDTNQTREILMQSVPKSGARMNDSEALDLYRTQSAGIAADITELEQMIATGGIKSSDLSKARQGLVTLRNLKGDVDKLVNQWGNGGGRAQAPQAQPGAVRKYNPATGRIE